MSTRAASMVSGGEPGSYCCTMRWAPAAALSSPNLVKTPPGRAAVTLRRGMRQPTAQDAQLVSPHGIAVDDLASVLQKEIRRS
jgi:hypothetical protein